MEQPNWEPRRVVDKPSLEAGRGLEPSRDSKTWGPQYSSNVLVFHSLERHGLTPVYGTACPPRGLSGRIRRMAYEKFGEGRVAHWMLLILADRVDVMEGLFIDLRQGRLPNIFRERGLGAQWKHNRRNFVRKTMIAATVLATVGLIFRTIQQRQKKEKTKWPTIQEQQQ